MRRVVFPLLLLGAVAAAVVATVVLEDNSDDGSATATTDLTEVTTPLLSARRVPEVVVGPSADTSLRQGLRSLVRTEASSPENSCLLVTRRGRDVISHRASEPMTPASTQKILTAAAALDRLGPDHRYRTVAGGVPLFDAASGVLPGDLWIIGSGDPVIETADYGDRFGTERVHTPLEDLADALVAAGLTRIDGAIIGDDTRYDDRRTVASWTDGVIDLNRAGPISALMVNDGFTSWPSDSPDNASATPSSDPPASLAAELDDLLEERGVSIGESPTSGERPEGVRELAAVESPRLRAIVADMNTYSDNTTAELLVKELGVLATGTGSTFVGAGAVDDLLDEMGTPTVFVADGSGLSGDNVSTCRTLVEVLDRAGRQSPLGQSLAVSGKPGTLEERFSGDIVAPDGSSTSVDEGDIWAKTGNLSGVWGLAGYARGRGGESLTFAYLVNDGDLDPAVVEQNQAVLAMFLARWPDGASLGQAGPVVPS